MLSLEWLQTLPSLNKCYVKQPNTHKRATKFNDTQINQKIELTSIKPNSQKCQQIYVKFELFLLLLPFKISFPSLKNINSKLPTTLQSKSSIQTCSAGPICFVHPIKYIQSRRVKPKWGYFVPQAMASLTLWLNHLTNQQLRRWANKDLITITLNMSPLKSQRLFMVCIPIYLSNRRNLIRESL